MNESAGATPAVDAFGLSLPFGLDPFQLKACVEVERGNSVLVAAPTGAGKTIVAEFAIALTMSAPSGRVFYTTPMKALSNQKFRELVERYGAQQVGLLTGDTSINGEARIVVMTTEVLRNMLYESRDLRELDFVVMDEVHYLADRFRGPVWEEVIIHLPKHVKIVSLSATVSNAEEFGAWLQAVRGDTSVVVSEIRPVPLDGQVLIRGQLVELFESAKDEARHRPSRRFLELAAARRPPTVTRDRQYRGRQEQQWRRAPRLDRVRLVETLEDADLLPAIDFIFSRAGCDAAVQQLVSEGVRLTTPDERLRIRAFVEERTAKLADGDLEALGYWDWLEGLERGIAAHHAGLLPAFKEVVEELFRTRLVRLVFATETLALGINMPARCVVLERLDKFNGEARVMITPGEYTQLTGRAGRRGIDTEGHSVIVWTGQYEPQEIANLASRRTYPLISAFKPTYNMAVNLLERLGRAGTRDILETCFAQFQADRSVVALASRVAEQRESLAGYEAAIERADDQQTQQRWAERRRKLRKDLRRTERQIDQRTGQIADRFDHITDILETLGYIVSDGDRITVTPDGERLRRIYGERDLLIAECLRQGIWDGLDAASLAALVSAIVYEARRDEGMLPTRLFPKGGIIRALDQTTTIWAELDELEQSHRLPGSTQPQTGLTLAVYRWARGAKLDEVLGDAGIAAGDFVRWTKQIIDVLEQLSYVADTGIATTARSAVGSIRRGIVDLNVEQEEE